MNAVLIILTSLSVAYLASRLSRRGPFTVADLAISLCSALISIAVVQFLSAEGAGQGLGLPLLLAGILTLGLESLSLQRRDFLL